MCQMRRPSPGRFAAYPERWRFSSRKYSEPPVPSFHSRCTLRLVLTSGNESVALLVTLVVVTQPWFTLHHAEGCDGMSPPPFHEPPAIRHQLPMPCDVSSMS